MSWLALVLGLLVANAGAARAAPGEGRAPRRFGENASRDYRSPQHFAFELKFTPYTPAIDRSRGLNAGATPFSDLFTSQTEPTRQDPKWQLLTQLEFDVQLFNKFGTLGIGATVGYYRRTTHSFEYTDATALSSCTFGSCVRSGDTTALNIIPLSLLVVYRFDVLAQRWRIPLVPYLKTGPAYSIWIIQNGAGGVAKATGSDGVEREGYGGTFGWVVHPGLALQLDFLDPSTARTLDAELGINHTHLFCELHYALIDGFGAADKLNLSGTTFSTGLAFEF
jgi:hypothetical protein